MNGIKEISYIAQNIGYFPQLNVSHGFSWGKEAGNMSFSYGDRVEVFQRVIRFFSKLNMGFVKDSVSINPEHKDKILLINKEVVSKLRPTRVGKIVNCDAVFIIDKEITVTVKAGDCQVFYIQGEDANKKQFVGLVHAGWRGVSAMLPYKSIDYAIKILGAKKETLKIFMMPSIKKEHRTMEHFNDINNEISHWGNFIKKKNSLYHTDEFGFAVKQIIDGGVLDKNIFFYDIDNYIAAQKGESFSQKLFVNETRLGKSHKEGRFIVAIRS